MDLLGKRDMPLDAPFSSPEASLRDEAQKLHCRLARFNHSRTSPGSDGLDWLATLQAEYRMRRLEHDLIELETAVLRPLAREAPPDPDRFAEWFERVEQLGPGQGDALFPFLAEEASYEQLRWFLQQDAAADAGLEDLAELTQLRFTPRLRAGRYRFGIADCDQAAGSDARGQIVGRLGRTLSVTQQATGPVLESLALSNVMVALAANHRYAYHSAGALAVRGAATAKRAGHILRAFDRLGIQPESSRYLVADGFDTSLRSWNLDALRALVAYEPAAASSIAEGVLLRLTTEARCFERYRNELQQLRPFASTLPAAMESMPSAPTLHA